MSNQFCPNCGKALTDPSNNCPSCGHAIPTASPSEQATPIQSQQQTNEGPPTNQPNKNKMFIIIGAIVVALLAFYFLQKDAPEDVAEEFYTRITELDLSGAKELISKDADAYILEEMEDMQEGLKNFPIELADSFKMKSNFNVLNVDKDGKEATVEAEISLISEDFTEEAFFELVKEKGKWKITYME